MKRIRPLFAVSVVLAMATLLPVAVFSVEPPAVPEPARSTSSTVVDVNGDPAALAAICERVAAGEIVEGVIYDCSAFPAFQIVCTDPERSSMDCFPDATPTPDNCWDCEGSTMTEAEKLAAACAPAVVAANPQHLPLCFPKKWAWVCFTADPARNITEHCEMYRRDLDPYGIFATPPPPPPPEPTPTPTPVPTATPDPTPVPDPENPATDTP
jgi:hypothetical protein